MQRTPNRIRRRANRKAYRNAKGPYRYTYRLALSMLPRKRVESHRRFVKD